MDAVSSTKEIRNDPAQLNQTFLQSPFVSEAHRYRERGLPNAMSVDVEDYFQVSAFESKIQRSTWDSIPSRLPRNIDKILEMFSDYDVTATFFTLGWVCEKFPEVVRKIASAGHEIASHGNAHARIGDLSRSQFRADVEGTRKLLEDTTGVSVRGYRAPSFSIAKNTLWAHDVLAETGYQYSSSVFPIKHDHYGIPTAPRFPFLAGSGEILEIPMSTVSLLGRNWPCAGGGYFRLMPLWYSKWAVERINRSEKMPAIFYFHPWEIDPGQPRISGIPSKTKFRHYLNLNKFEHRLAAMSSHFRWDRVDRVFLDAQ